MKIKKTKKMKLNIKQIFFWLFFSFLIIKIAFASDINLSLDRAQVSEREPVNLSLKINGQVDNNQVSIVGLNNFDIVSQSTSQEYRMINGYTTSSQIQNLTLIPKRAGKVKIQAIAYENGKEIKSNEVWVNIGKSLINQTKDKLINSINHTNNLNNNFQNQNNQNQVNQQNIQTNQNTQTQNNFDFGLGEKKEYYKKLLTLPQNQNSNNQSKIKKDESLEDFAKKNHFENFPKVKKEFVFNSWFWLEFFGIIFLILSSLYLIFGFKKDRK